MGFDRNKVNWTSDELLAAEGADMIYEALKDGLQVGQDGGVLFAGFTKLLPLLRTFSSAGEFADKFIDLAVLLKRDNDWLKSA